MSLQYDCLDLCRYFHCSHAVLRLADLRHHLSAAWCSLRSDAACSMNGADTLSLTDVLTRRATRSIARIAREAAAHVAGRSALPSAPCLDGRIRHQQQHQPRRRPSGMPRSTLDPIMCSCHWDRKLSATHQQMQMSSHARAVRSLSCEPRWRNCAMWSRSCSAHPAAPAGPAGACRPGHRSPAPPWPTTRRRGRLQLPSGVHVVTECAAACQRCRATAAWF